MTMTKAKLSAVIITLNEEKNIGRCLESLKLVADEIIVVDSLSTDKTKAICESFGVRFIEQAFLGYIEQKSFALAAASHDYVLSLDADESLSASLIEAIQIEKQKGFTAAGYRFNRLTNYCGTWIKHGAWYPDKKIRLIKKGSFTWGGENPHDRLESPITDVVVRDIPHDILHYSYHLFSENILQSNKFSTISARAQFAKGKRPSYLKLLFNPPWTFFYGFIIRGGFLDGWKGFVIAKMAAIHNFYKYYKLIELYENNKD